MEIFLSHAIEIFIGAAVAVIALVFYLQWKRGKDLENVAASLGLSFSQAGPGLDALEGTGLEIFRLGYSRKATHLVRVQVRAGTISVFDYRYLTRGGKNNHSHNFTLALIDCAGCAVPDFELKPETFIYKIGEALGFKDIDLPAFPLFSDKYRLTGADAAAVHLFFTPQRAAWFERNPGLRVQGSHRHIVLFKGIGYLPAGRWPGFIGEAKTFAAEVL